MILLRKILLLLVQGIAALIGLLATFILIMLFIWPYIALLFSPFSFEEADIDGNGFISPDEASYYTEYIENHEIRGGKKCVDYISTKSGTDNKTKCE